MSMFTPGQLIRQQRGRRAWTQAGLAQRSGMGRSMLSRYENDSCYPSWEALCRIMAAMGMQPRVVAEECDVTLHARTANDRRDFADATSALNGVWMTADTSVELADIVLPDTLSPVLPVLALRPIAALLEGFDYAFTGRASLRMQGISCPVPYVSAVLSHQAGVADDMLWRRLGERCTETSMHLWSPRLCCYRRSPSHCDLADAAAAAAGELAFRTRETATELRVRLTDAVVPPHVTRQVAGMELPLLALSEYRTVDGKPLVDVLASYAMD